MNAINRVATVDSLIGQTINRLCRDYDDNYFDPLFAGDGRGSMADAHDAIRSNDLALCLHKLTEARNILLKPVEISGKGKRIEERKLKLAYGIREMAPVIDAAILLLEDRAGVAV